MSWLYITDCSVSSIQGQVIIECEKKHLCSLLINSCLFILWGNGFSPPITKTRTCYKQEKQERTSAYEKYEVLTKYKFWSCFPLSLLHLFHYDAVVSLVHSPIKLKGKGTSTILYAYFLPASLLFRLFNRWPQRRYKSIKRLHVTWVNLKRLMKAES